MTLIRDGRDLRVDFFRGLALWWIFTDHIPGNVLARLSLRNYALCDATEIFVLLAGFGAGMAYGRMMDRNGWLYAGADAIRRAWTLYIAHIFLFVVFAAQVSYSAATLDRASYLEEIHLDVMADAPYRALLEALTLRYQPAYLNILPMYIALLALFAVALPLLRRPRVLLLLSLAMYALARAWPINLPSWTGGGWYFNPLAWQLLFVIGALAAYAPPTMPRRPRVFDALATATVLFGLGIIWIVFWQPALAAALPPGVARLLGEIDKTGLHPLRLASIMALAWLAIRLIPADARWLRGRLAAPFVLCGQHSLGVFCAGIVMSFLGRLAMEDSDGAAMQIAVNVVGAAALLGVGALAAWYREKARGPKQRAKVGALLVAGGLALVPHARAQPACPPSGGLDQPTESLDHVAAAMRSGTLGILVLDPTAPAAILAGRISDALRARRPALAIRVTRAGSRDLTAAETLPALASALAASRPALVLWPVGINEAVQDQSPDAFADALGEGAAQTLAAGADLILVDPPFSRFLRANTDLDPYLEVTRQTAALPSVTLFRRFELMHDWADGDLLDLERAAAPERTRVADRLHHCLAEALANLTLAGAAMADPSQLRAKP